MKRIIGVVLLVLGVARVLNIYFFPNVGTNNEAPIQDMAIAGFIGILGLALVLAKPKVKN